MFWHTSNTTVKYTYFSEIKLFFFNCLTLVTSLLLEIYVKLCCLQSYHDGNLTLQATSKRKKSSRKSTFLLHNNSQQSIFIHSVSFIISLWSFSNSSSISSKSTPGNIWDELEETVDSWEVKVVVVVVIVSKDSNDSSCFSAHLLNKSFPFLLEVLWTSGLEDESRPVGRMLVPSLDDDDELVLVIMDWKKLFLASEIFPSWTETTTTSLFSLLSDWFLATCCWQKIN